MKDRCRCQLAQGTACSFEMSFSLPQTSPSTSCFITDQRVSPSQRQLTLHGLRAAKEAKTLSRWLKQMRLDGDQPAAQKHFIYFGNTQGYHHTNQRRPAKPSWPSEAAEELAEKDAGEHT